MEKTYIGIDPGAKGVIAVQYPEAKEFLFLSDHTNYEIADFLASVKAKSENVMAVIEDVHAILGSSAKATFEFGRIKGFLLGLLTAHKIPYVPISPKKWQNEMWEHCDGVMDGNKVNTKATSANCAMRLFPNMDFRKSERCKKVDDNLIDAILMSEYAKRRNL